MQSISKLEISQAQGSIVKREELRNIVVKRAQDLSVKVPLNNKTFLNTVAKATEDTLKVPNKTASQSLTSGILAVAIPSVLTFFLWHTEITIILIFIAIPAIVVPALVLSLIAVVKGIKALNQFHDSPGTYSGRGEAYVGLIFGILVLIGLVALLYLAVSK